MSKTARQKIVIIGCGNVAWHVAKHLHSLKKYALFVYNHRANPSLNLFSSELKCKTEASLENVINDADYYFVCVSDKFISDAADKVAVKNTRAVMLHTSGSARLEALGERVHGTGVFYPLQTFSKEDAIEWKGLPVIVEAGDEAAKKKILNLSKEFTDKVITLSYKERLKLHLAAVLVNNFTNALFVAASELAGKKSEGGDLKLLLPLIKQTVSKVERMNPRKAQTGPAKRGDEGVMDKHLALLSKQPELKEIYKQMSKLILKQSRARLRIRERLRNGNEAETSSLHHK